MSAGVTLRQSAKSLTKVRRSPGFLVYAGLSGMAAATGVNCTYLALQRAEVVVSPMVSASPLLLASLFLSVQERVDRWLVFSTVITVGSVALVVLGSTL